MPFKPFETLRSSCKMPSLYRDNPSTTEDQTLLPKSEKHVSFDPDLQYHEIQDIRKKQRKRTISRRLHTFGLLLLFLGLLFYSHAWRVSVLVSSLTTTLTSSSILTTTDTIQP